MYEYVVRALADRHRMNLDDLLEAWSERAAIREDGGPSRGGSSRRCAELEAVHDIERMFKIGLHCPETRRRMIAGGDRMQPGYTKVPA